MFSQLFDLPVQLFVMTGVKNLMVNKYNFPFTKIVDDIMEQNQGNYWRQIPMSFC